MQATVLILPISFHMHLNQLTVVEMDKKNLGAEMKGKGIKWRGNG